MKYRGLRTSTTILALVLSACDDAPVSPKTNSELRPQANVATDPEIIVRNAVAGLGKRYEQDEMLKIESKVPGFGGYFRDSTGQVVAYLKRNSPSSHELLRAVLHAAYASRPEGSVRAAMATASNARVIEGSYSLSELVAVHNRISFSKSPIPGFVGVGVSYIRNRVVLAFNDEAEMNASLAELRSAGVDTDAIVPEVWRNLQASATFSSTVRPTAAGLEIGVFNRTRVPGNPNIVQYIGSLGYNVQSEFFTPYFMVASHVVNGLSGTNGALGDTVAQTPAYFDGWAWIINKIGVIVNNPPYVDAASCGVTGVDYCTSSDVALGQYLPNVSSSRKVATSTREGLNGSIGTLTINGYYGIKEVLPVEMAINSSYGIHKSGFHTGTTTGYIDVASFDINLSVCWNAAAPALRYLDISFARRMTNTGGDSGAPVFMGNGSPYSALGSLVGAGGLRNPDGTCTEADKDLCITFFSKWSNIQSALGPPLSPVT